MIKGRQKFLVFIALLVVAICWAVLSFNIRNELVDRFSLWASLVFGTGSIMTSVLALIISINSFRKTEEMRNQKIVEEANKFINSNNNEILYIPLCIIANAYDNHHHFIRAIYNSFNVLNDDVQKEVLKQLHYDYEILNNNAWIDAEICNIQNFIKDNELGKDFLYDNAKYFHRAIKYSEKYYDGKCEIEHILPDYFNWNPKIFFIDDKAYQENVTFYDYVDSYLHTKKSDPVLFQIHKQDKPLDLLSAIANLHYCEESIICYWMMEVVVTIAVLMQQQINVEEPCIMSRGDAEILTYEDRYLNVLMELYNLAYLREQISLAKAKSE